MIQQCFEAIQQKAVEEGFLAWIQEAEGDTPYQELYCLFHVDDKEREYVAQFMFVNQITELAGIEQDEDEIIMLQIAVLLPFPVEEKDEAETALLLHFLNRNIPLGHFAYYEDQGIILYKSFLSSSDYAVPVAQSMEALRMTQHFVVSLCPLIEPVASGEIGRMDIYRVLYEKAGEWVKGA